jgi:signal transduction histidine kinase
MRRTHLLVVLAAAGAAAVGCNAAAYAAGPRAALVLASIGWTLAGIGAVSGLAAGLPKAATDFRRAWGMLLVGSVLWLLGQLVWDGYLMAGATPPIPSAGDLGWLLFAAFAGGGVVRFARPAPAVRWVVRVEALAIVAATAAALVAVLHHDLASSHGSLVLKATALAYPLCYCAFAALLLDSIGRQPALLRIPGLALILAGATVEAVAFTLWSPRLFAGSYVAGRNAEDLLWTLGCLAIGAGGFFAATRNLPARRVEHVLRDGSPATALAFASLLTLQVVAVVDAWPQAVQSSFRVALLVVGGALFFRAWTMSRLWAQTLARERQARGALERANRELEAFSYSASHDLKAPLVSIQGFAASLRRRSGSHFDERSMLYLDRIESNAVALQKLIGDLLDYARAGGAAADPSGIDADAIARDVVRSFQERHGGHGANVELLCPRSALTPRGSVKR